MRNNLLLLSALLFSTRLAVAAEAYILKTEFSKNPVYEGESTTAKFILYGTSSFVEAEVAKFPEFRGFWTQNHVLRQGPLPLVADSGPRGLNEALIGSYTITPMVGKKSPEIVPMKMIIRSHDFFSGEASSEGMEIWSDKEQLTVLPLPAPPSALQKKFFGAVGALAAYAESDTAHFRPDEPLTIRIALKGIANFADINELYTPWPERVQVISKRTFLDASLPPTKIFEYTLVVKGETSLQLPPIEAVYFNTVTKNYETAATANINLEPQPAVPLEALEPDVFGAPIKTEQVPLDWAKSPIFWLAQAVLALIFMGILGGRWRRSWMLKPSVRFRNYLKARGGEIAGALESGNSQQVLRLLESLLMRGRPADSKQALSHRQRLAEIEKKWAKEDSDQARWVFETWDQGFAPPDQRPSEPPPSRLKEVFSRLLRAFRRR